MKTFTSLLARVSLLPACLAAAIAAGAAAPQDQEPPTDALHRPLDLLLDLYVRDGLVYYRALKSDRGRLDRYAASLNVPAATYEAWSREQKMAFWLNAYNTFVLQTVIDAYPIRGGSSQYPQGSIRQIPGAFEKLRRRAAGRSVTLDEIEKTILPEFKEPRVYLALGRGAVGSGRLRSEAYSGNALTRQLDAVQAESVTDRQIVKVDRTGGVISVTPIVGWHEAEFAAAYDKAPTGPLAQRSPIERAIVAFITPHLLPLEREFVTQNEFRIAYHAFDWRLNDLTGHRVD
jgi:Protein of unknown function, DUF547